MINRPEVVQGITHKVKIPTRDGEFAFYITINKPYEIFVNCKNSRYAEHMTALTLLISMMLKNEIPLQDIAAELKSIESAETGHMSREGWVPSLYASIGDLLLQE